MQKLCSVKPNYCHFSQLCYTFTGHQLNAMYYVRQFTSTFSSLCATMATIYVYAIGSIYFRGAYWHPLAYDIIIMQFTVVMIQRLFLIFHLHNITIQNTAYVDSDSYTDSDLTLVLWEASSMSIFQLRKNDKGTKNVVERNGVFDTQQLEEYFRMSKNYKNYGKSDTVKKLRKTVENKRYHLKSENNETLESIEDFTGNSKKGNRNPMKQQTDRCVKMTNSKRECSFDRKRSYPRNKRKIPSSLEESNKKKQKIKIEYCFQNASVLPDGS